MDITEWPTNIHEYHTMMATAQAKAMEIQRNQKKVEEVSVEKENNNEPE